VTQRVLGSSTLTTNYTYYPWTTVNGRGRLQNISTGSLQNTSYTYRCNGLSRGNFQTRRFRA
jgi:hypothetical protein